MNTLVWIGFCQAMFAAILMFNKNEQTVSDKILSAWLVLLAIEFLTAGMDYQFYKTPLLSGSHLLSNAAFYLYVRSLTRSGFHLKYRHLAHLLPFLIFKILAYILNAALMMGDYLVYEEDYMFRFSYAITSLVSWLIYSPLSLTMVYHYRANLLNQTSRIETNENIRWLMTVTVFYVIYCFLTYIISFVLIIKGDYYSSIPEIINYSLLLFLLYMLSFYGLRQKHIPEAFQISNDKKNKKKPLLDDQTRKEIGKQVLAYFQEKKAYLNPDLNMDILSADLQLPKHQLTEVLNTELGKNFFRLVNSYRIEAVKKMLAGSRNHYSIEAIGFECGFSNKSSFYKIFKETVGETPSEYKKRISEG